MLKLEKVTFEAKKGHKAQKILDGVTFSVEPGEIVVITGPNGSGKSTLAKIIAGVEMPQGGKIIFKGEDITDKNCTERARMGIAYSLQVPVHFKGLTVRDLLQIAVTGGEAFLDENPPKVDGFLRKVGLEPEQYLEREINSSLSGGELKRIEIASVIARNASFTIFDEPEAGIDIWSFNNLIKVFKDMHKNSSENAIVIISHQERIMQLADRIIVLKDGKVALDDKGEKVLAQMGDVK
ncbi:ATP-binding cassette domain-containing protein [Candidatus Saccharibacteria bacterium]|nr:ATP-binding cassette domain-containing protein [Candidatus Saccharibacteria bacterium]